MNFFDIQVLNFINHTLSNQVFNFVMPFISRLGQGELYFALGILLIFSRKKELKILGISLLAGLTISYYLVYVLKILIARPRPFVVFSNIILLGPAEKGYSFPSNHAVAAFMVASLLAANFKKYILFYSLAALIGFSRIYMGVHYPTDILAGAAIGIIIGILLSRLINNGLQNCPRGPIG